VSDLNIILVIPDRNTGTRLSNHISNKYGVRVTLCNDLHEIEDAQADGIIIYRNSVESLNSLEHIKGKIALLYGNISVPSSDRGVNYTKITGNLPGCVHSFIESLVGWQGVNIDLEWEETTDLDSSQQPAQKISRSVAVFSPGGGVGKTTAAVHLAKLAEQARVNIGVIETDEDKGGVLRFLGKQPAQLGLDSLEETDWGNEALFKRRIGEIVQKVGRIQVVPMVGTLNGLVCNIKNVSVLHEWSRSEYDLTIYDLPPRLRDVMTYSVLEEADEVILVTEPTDVLMDALQKHLRLCKEVQQFHELPKKYRLLINKVPEREGLDPEEMAEALGLPLLGVIPADLEHYNKIINRAKFDIPADSPWRMVYANLGLGGACNQIMPIQSPAKEKGFAKGILKIPNGLFSFFFGNTGK
jgi:ATP-binding protein involved in chromosome partitioning